MHAHARSRAGLETKGGRARAKITSSRDWRERIQHAAAIFPPIRAAEIKSLDFTHTHTHTHIQRKKEKSVADGSPIYLPPPGTLYWTLIGYDCIWEYNVEFSPQRVLCDLFLNGMWVTVVYLIINLNVIRRELWINGKKMLMFEEYCFNIFLKIITFIAD